MFDPFEPGRKYTVQEYAKLEELSDIKHDYRYGFVFPTGSPPPPIPIPNAPAVFATLSKRIESLLDFPGIIARPLAEPDESGIIICARRTSDDAVQTDGGGFSKPSAIILLTSIATFAKTRHELFDAYRAKESVKEMAWIFADHPRAEIYRRSDDGAWRNEFFASLDGEVHLQSLGVRFQFADIYAVSGYSFVDDPFYSSPRDNQST